MDSDPFQALLDASSQQQQLALNAEAQSSRRQRLRNRLQMVYWPRGSDPKNYSEADNGLWTAEAWSDRFLAAAALVAADGLAAISSAIETASKTPGQAAAVECWRLAFLGDRAALIRGVATIIADKLANIDWEHRGLEVIDWLVCDTAPPSASETSNSEDASPQIENLVKAETDKLAIPAAGRFVLMVDKDNNGDEWRQLAMQWTTADGREVEHIAGDDRGLVLSNGSKNATWLPRGWEISVCPTNWTPEHLAKWFDYALDVVRKPLTGERSQHYPTHAMLRHHAYLIAQHLVRTPATPETQIADNLDGTIAVLEELRQLCCGAPTLPQDKKAETLKTPTVETEWTPPDSPQRWVKVFGGISVRTLMRRFKDGTIRHKKLSTKSYQIAIVDLPATHQAKFRNATK